MRNRPLKVGVSAALTVDRTPHARTLLRAVATALNGLPGANCVSMIFADDAASPDTAVSIARRFVDQRVDVVIGPFASNCLCVTTEIYAAAKIPLVLPAATVHITGGSEGCFRLCPSDDLIAYQLAERVLARGFSRVAVEASATTHGARLRDAICWNLARRQVQVVGRTSAQAAVYVGTLAASKRWLDALRRGAFRLPAFLTDDAACEQLLDDLPGAGDIEVVGFPTATQVPEAGVWAARYQRYYGSAPPIYFLEVLAAMSIVIQAAQSDRSCRESLQEDVFDTPFGRLRFESGEQPSATCAIWRPDQDGALRPQELMPVQRPAEQHGQAVRIA